MAEKDLKMKENTKKSRKKDELLELTVDYRNKMAEEKYRKLKLGNDHQAVDLAKKQDTICYRAVAMQEFEKAIGSIYARIKNADEQLVARLKLNIQQADLLHEYMEDILEDLANIDINIDSTTTFDAEHYKDGIAKRDMLLNSN